MKTDTQNRALAYIKQKITVAPKDLKAYLGISYRAVFAQLRKMLDKELVVKTGRPPKVFYSLKPMDIQNALQWATADKPPTLNPDIYCQTRDVFQARADALLLNLRKSIRDDNLSCLLVAVAGEIGNNSYDHNLGNWRDVPGAYFSADAPNRRIVLADRGQGVFATIIKVKPETRDDADALRAAFTETISGRAPEQRGNGLKFVKKIIEENNLTLEFYSGHAVCEIKGIDPVFTPRLGNVKAYAFPFLSPASQIKNKKMEIKNSDKNILGALAIIKF